MKKQALVLTVFLACGFTCAGLWPIVAQAAVSPCQVPDVVGMHKEDARNQIQLANLLVAAEITQHSDTVPADHVIRQNPSGGTLVSCGSGVALTISDGPPACTVPNVAAQTEAEAHARIEAADLSIGAVVNECSNTVDPNHVISQDPAAETSVECASEVSLVISTGRCPSPAWVPDVVGKTQAEAETTLNAANLVKGLLAYECSDSVPQGRVISQDPTADAVTVAGSEVSLVISTGPCPLPAWVPDVVGMQEDQAKDRIEDANLVPVVDANECSNTVPQGHVISQDPPADTVTVAGSEVSLVISTGPCPCHVPDVMGETEAEAETILNAANLVKGLVAYECSDTVPIGDVISQEPVAGTPVQCGSPVNLVVSSPTACVPNIVGLSELQAQHALNAVGLVKGTVSYKCSDTVPVGDVISQDPALGTAIQCGSTVNLVVSSATIDAPDVIGMTEQQAAGAIITAGLVVGNVTTQTSTQPTGTVIAQTPLAGASVPCGSAVDLVISDCRVDVPDVIGMTEQQAAGAIITAGLVVGNVTTQTSTLPTGTVIAQTPIAGASVPCGSTVDLVISDCRVEVPDVIGMTEQQAAGAISTAGLVVGNVTTQTSTQPTGTVIAQTPIAAELAPCGSAVDLVISDCRVDVPDVVGMSEPEARTAILTARLAIGPVIYECSDTITQGYIIRQEPPAETLVPCGTAVTLIVSTGPCPCRVPDVVGMPEDKAKQKIEDSGLVPVTANDYSDTVPKGYVISQNPDAETSVICGSEVELVVSLGLAVYVDDDAPEDPAPGNPNVSDPLEDGTAEHPFDSIQQGIDAAGDGQTVLIADGIYTGLGNRDLDFKAKPITVRSQNGPQSCIIDCEASRTNYHRGFGFYSGEDASSILDGLTIKNGYASSGGGIWADTNTSPTITNCVITKCRAQISGGGLYGCSGHITNCTISANWAAEDNCGLSNCDGTITNCTIVDNIGSGLYDCDGRISDCNIAGNSGLGLDHCDGLITSCDVTANSEGGLDNCNGTISYCDISDNFARFGAGLSNCSGSIAGCIITDNTASGDGGGLYNCDAQIENCTISRNLALWAGALWQCSGSITNSVISNNYARFGSGGLVSCSGAISNCTITANSVSGPEYAGGLYHCQGDITNCIVWANTNPQLARCSMPDFSCIQGVADGNNISDDPLFADSDNDDYHLKSQAGRWDTDKQAWVFDDVTSPCVDAGNPDIDWGDELWPHGRRINAGAYGGTTEASMSLSEVGIIADLTDNLRVNFEDFSLLAQLWLAAAPLLPEDLDRNGTVGCGDVVLFAEFWLDSQQPHLPAETHEDFETGDFSRHNWLTTGNAHWSVVSDVVYQGSYAARSGAVRDKQQSVLELTLWTRHNRISFTRSVSSESGYDYLSFYIDGIKQDEWSGRHDWALETFTISPNHRHTFRWVYNKDYSGAEGSDCAWLDDIRLYFDPGW